MIPNPQQTYPWKGQMSIPRDLSLKETKNGIRLVQVPSAIIKNNLAKLSHNEVVELSNLKINNQELPVDKEHKIPGNSYWINAELSIEPGTVGGF